METKKIKTKAKTVKPKTSAGGSRRKPPVTPTTTATTPTPRRRPRTPAKETVVKEFRRTGNRRLTASERNLCITLRMQGYTIFETAQKLECDPATVCKWSKKGGYSTSHQIRKYMHVSHADFILYTTGRKGTVQFTTLSGNTYNILKF